MPSPLLAAGPALLRRVDHLQRTANPHGRYRPLACVRPAAAPAPKLQADPAAGCIWHGETCLLSGIPEAAWRYRLGNRSALDWVLDQYRDRRPKDPTIRAHFDTYRVADHLAELSLLLARVATVSVKTMDAVDALAARSPLNPASSAAPLVYQRPAPVTKAEARQLLLDFGRSAESAPLPATVTLALSRGQSDFYLEWLGTEREGNALECLLDAHGLAWDPRVACYDTTQYWQGPKGRPGSWVASLVLVPAS